jgi:hypothetical protein
VDGDAALDVFGALRPATERCRLLRMCFRGTGLPAIESGEALDIRSKIRTCLSSRAQLGTVLWAQRSGARSGAFPRPTLGRLLTTFETRRYLLTCFWRCQSFSPLLFLFGRKFPTHEHIVGDAWL